MTAFGLRGVAAEEHLERIWLTSSYAGAQRLLHTLILSGLHRLVPGIPRFGYGLSVLEGEFVEDFPAEQLLPLQSGQPGGIRRVTPLGLDDIDLAVDDRLRL